MEQNYSHIMEGDDCRSFFRKAYENRYTWGRNFNGYSGSCLLDDGQSTYEGKFSISKDMKATINDIEEEEISKLIASQLWEVSIHLIRREFEIVHKDNTFTAGNTNSIGLEVIVGGKNLGDKYRIKDNIVKMVYRHIHGSLVNIFTVDTIDTGEGYLSTNYTSQYLESSTGLPKTAS